MWFVNIFSCSVLYRSYLPKGSFTEKICIFVTSIYREFTFYGSCFGGESKNMCLALMWKIFLLSLKNFKYYLHDITLLFTPLKYTIQRCWHTCNVQPWPLSSSRTVFIVLHGTLQPLFNRFLLPSPPGLGNHDCALCLYGSADSGGFIQMR